MLSLPAALPNERDAEGLLSPKVSKGTGIPVGSDDSRGPRVVDSVFSE